MRTLVLLAILLLCGGGAPVWGQKLEELRWLHKLTHYTPAEAPAYDAWVIVPSAGEAEGGQDLEKVVDAIAGETKSAIAHIYLHDLIRRSELQEAVMSYVAAQPEFQKHPPPAGFGRWEFKNADRMRMLVSQGILQSPFGQACTAVLAKHGKSVRKASMEKLFFTKKDGKWAWDAIVWLLVDEPPKSDGKK